ncbi:hypothetical protein [Natrinema sp. 1APR25-10V2]|uniref:hypothetical protein n=1 Tax=Natrinema sp. 1APR25-10V2 TaxID=2951081 RepID=UPI002874BF8D|nr:hypothetical protein [Natrinema sp. 1APR25-10V2]MDS0478671.1 hypothetical protein [Natrinema sp. 1APR25-10V2]
MPRPKIGDETQERLDDMIDETVGVRPGYLTFNQKVELVLDELEKQQQKSRSKTQPGNQGVSQQLSTR